MKQMLQMDYEPEQVVDIQYPRQRAMARSSAVWVSEAVDVAAIMGISPFVTSP